MRRLFAVIKILKLFYVYPFTIIIDFMPDTFKYFRDKTIYLLGVLARPSMEKAGRSSLPFEVSELSRLYAGPGPSFLNSVTGK